MVAPLVAPLIGAAARLAAKTMAKKGAKEGAKKGVKEGAKEKIKEGAKNTAKAAGAAGAAGTTYLVGEAMSPSGSGPVMEAIRDMQRESLSEGAKEAEAKRRAKIEESEENPGMKKGGVVKKAKPKATKSRGDGCCVKGKTKGRMV